MKKKLLTLAALSLPLFANAAVIDFESAATAGCQVSNGGNINGFTLSPYNGLTGAGFNNASDCSFLRDSAHGGNNFMLNFNSVVGSFTRDVGVFSLLGLWVAADTRSTPATVRFSGLDGVGGNTLYSMDVSITSAWSEVSFAGWDGVKTFTWDSLQPSISNIAIDDFRYSIGSQVPEPATLALLGIALAGVGAIRRKKA